MTPRLWAALTGATVLAASAVIYLATDYLAHRGEDHNVWGND